MGGVPFDALSPDEQSAFLQEPALATPDGVIPNLADPVSRNGLGLSVTVACTVIASVALLLRVYSFFVYRKETRVQEGLAFISVGTFCGLLYPGYQLAITGVFFVHQWNMDHHQWAKVLYLGYITSTMWVLTMLFAKTAILLELLRVFWPGHSRNTVYWVCNITLLLVSLYFTAAFIFLQARCRPLKKSWNPWIGGTCADSGIIDKVSIYINIVFDLVILVLPQIMIWKLHASLKRRIGKSIIFSFVVLSIASDIGQAHSIHSFEYDGDSTSSLSSAYLWAVANCTSILLAYCALPISRILTEPKTPPVIIWTKRWYKMKFASGDKSPEVHHPGKSNRWRDRGPAASKLPKKSNSAYERMEDTGNSEVHLTELQPVR